MADTETTPKCFSFTENGFLPPGIHELRLSELKPLVFTNEHRRWMWYRLIGFMAWPLFVRGFSHVYLAGSFLSTKEYPEDVDVILQTKDPYGTESFAVVERFFLVGLERIRDFYTVDVHFWMDGAPSGLADYRSFFQYGRPPNPSPIDPARRGIVRLPISQIDLTELSAHFSPTIARDASTNERPLPFVVDPGE